MSKDIQVIANDLGAVPEIFKNKQVDISAFTAGIQPSFPVVSIKAGHWGVRFGGETTPFTEADPRAGGAQTAVSHLDVVLIAAASTISKSFYAADYQEGSNEPPTCWSSDGVTPDASILAENKQNPICASCPQNARGSKIANGKMLRACSDIKRLAVARQVEIDNPLGPILLRVMPGSMSNYRTYLQWLAGRHRAPFTVVTRLTFDTEASFPKIKFHALRGLNNEEAVQVADILEHPMLNSVLNGKDMAAFIDPEQEEKDAAGGLPPAGGLPAAGSKWSGPITPPTPPSNLSPKPKAEPEVLPPGITAEIWAQLPDVARNAMRAAMPKPEPVKPKIVLPPGMTQAMFDGLPGAVQAAMYAAQAEPELLPPTAEELKARAAAAAAAAPKGRGRPRSKPVGPPVTTTSVTQSSNGTEEPKDPSDVGNDLTNRIAGLAGRKA